jgi:hypothetical protein
MEKSVTPLDTKLDQMWTEAGVIIPGAQALSSVQLIAMLTTRFDRLPSSAKVVQPVALCLVALIVLMISAALHRLSFDGENSARFLRFGTAFLIVSPLPLAGGVSAELYVVILKVLENPLEAAAPADATGFPMLMAFLVSPAIATAISEQYRP